MSDDFDPETQAPKESSEVELEALLKSLRTEHRRIDSEIKALIETGVADMLKVQRMKKIKLSLKDQMTFIENQLTPDIIA
jgi:hypothetical protein